MDLAEVIGKALALKLAGKGHRLVADELAAPVSTVRGWVGRFSQNAGWVRDLFTALAYRLDPCLEQIEPRASPSADALKAIEVAAKAASRRLGPCPVWDFVSGATGGGLLSNTSPHLPLA